MASPTSGDEYEIPLRDQRYFGTGIKRKRIHFVPSTSSPDQVAPQRSGSSSSAADRYLSIVLKRQDNAQRRSEDGEVSVVSSRRRDECEGKDADDEGAVNKPSPSPQGVSQFVEVGGIPQDSRVGHEARERDLSPSQAQVHPPSLASAPFPSDETSLTHQIRLPHSHPPSHVDRNRLGLSVLSRQGWDPDSRRGLGAGGEGTLYPIKATDNPGRAGLGVKKEDLEGLERRAKQEGIVKLDAGAIRRQEKDNRKKAAELRDQFYRSQDLEKYLGDAVGTGSEGHERTSRSRRKRR